MPIVSHKVESSTAADGSLHVTLRFYDGDGIEYTPSPIHVPAGFDIAAKVAQQTAQLNEQLARSEFRRLIG